MGKLLIVGNPSQERDCLALILEFAGHQCAIANTLEEASALVQKDGYNLILADSVPDGLGVEETVRALRRVAPKASVMFLTEEVEPRLRSDEVISGPQPAIERGGAAFSVVSLGEALAVLLPKPEASRRLAELPKTPGVLNRLAGLYQAQKEYETAAELYRQALEIAEHAKKAREVATLLYNLASLYHEQEKYAAAEPLYKQSLEMVEKTYGPNHEKTARRLRNLADLYQTTGRSDLAAPILKRLKGP